MDARRLRAVWTDTLQAGRQPVRLVRWRTTLKTRQPKTSVRASGGTVDKAATVARSLMENPHVT